MIRNLITLIITLVLTLIPLKSNATTTAQKNVSSLTVKQYIVKHSVEMGIDPAIGLSIAKLESGYCHNKTSRYGAVGVFQLMPSTAKKLGYNAYHLNDNIKGGLLYYKMMYQKFGSMELALAAYNAGPGNVSRYKGMPPFGETKKFVSNIMAEYNRQKTNPDPVIHSVKQSMKAKPQAKPEVKKTTAAPSVSVDSHEKENVLSMSAGSADSL